MHTILVNSVEYLRPSKVYEAVKNTYGKTNIHLCHRCSKLQRAIVLNYHPHYLRYRVIRRLSLREKHTPVANRANSDLKDTEEECVLTSGSLAPK